MRLWNTHIDKYINIHVPSFFATAMYVTFVYIVFAYYNDFLVHCFGTSKQGIPNTGILNKLNIQYLHLNSKSR